MGMVFGKVGVETPKFEVIKSTGDYEIRKYPSCLAAEVTNDPSQYEGKKDGGFFVLANYIGALGGNPKNTKPEKIAMTAPVITKSSNDNGEVIAMTAPVLTKSDDKMLFLLPSKYKKVEEVPEPVDKRVVIKEVEERKHAVVTFSGVASDKVVERKVEELKKVLERDGVKVTGEFELGRYNPPWLTLPPFRTNEITIPVQ